jgi:hypothetical protein
VDEPEALRAVAAAMSVASALGLAADDATILSDSNRLVVRLLPCDTVARVTPIAHFASAAHEVELARQLAQVDSPIGMLDARVEPRIVEHDGFQIALWTHVEPAPVRTLPPAEYAQALARLHAGLREVDVTAPHVAERVEATQRDVDDRDVTPDLTDVDRALLAGTLRDLWSTIVGRQAPEQVLHGEPHPWNVLDTTHGPLFIDFENTCRGPVEYDLGWVPKEVGDAYSGADQELVEVCRGLVVAIVTMHRWRRDDRHPSGRAGGVAFLDVLRAGPPWPALETITW